MLKTFLQSTSQLSSSLSQPTHFIMTTEDRDGKYLACGIAQSLTLLLMIIMCCCRAPVCPLTPISRISIFLDINGMLQFAMGLCMLIWVYYSGHGQHDSLGGFEFEFFGSLQQALYFFIILSMGECITDLKQKYNNNRWIRYSVWGIIVCLNMAIY